MRVMLGAEIGPIVYRCVYMCFVVLLHQRIDGVHGMYMVCFVVLFCGYGCPSQVYGRGECGECGGAHGANTLVLVMSRM